MPSTDGLTRRTARMQTVLRRSVPLFLEPQTQLLKNSRQVPILHLRRANPISESMDKRYQKAADDEQQA